VFGNTRQCKGTAKIRNGYQRLGIEGLHVLSVPFMH
jgi:hypothetical protein